MCAPNTGPSSSPQKETHNISVLQQQQSKKGPGEKQASSLFNLRNYRPNLTHTPMHPKTPQHHVYDNSRDLNNNNQSTGTPSNPNFVFSEYTHGYDLTPSGIQRLMKEQQRSGSISPLERNEQQWLSQHPPFNLAGWMHR